MLILFLFLPAPNQSHTCGWSLSMIITVCRCSTSLPIRPLLPPYPLAPTAAPLPSKSAAFPWSRSLPSRPPCLLCCPPGRHYLPRTKTILRSIRCRVLLHVAQARQFDSSLSRCRFRPPSSWVYDCFAVAKSCQPPCAGECRQTPHTVVVEVKVLVGLSLLSALSTCPLAFLPHPPSTSCV